MRKIMLVVLGLVFLPGVAFAEKGSGTDRDKLLRDVEAMQRDGRWERAIAEGRANRQAFEALQQAPQPGRMPTATGSARPSPR